MPYKIKKRPLSPFMIPRYYSPQMTSVMSILHRMTGAANAIGLLLFSWWLMAAAGGIDSYNYFIAFITSYFGLFLLFGWTVSVVYHMCNGIRHLIWDTGKLFKIENAYKAGYIVLAMTALLTLLIWIS